MKASVFSVMAPLVGATLCLVSLYVAGARSAGQSPANKDSAERKAEPGKWEGTWELVQCDYRHTIGYHPMIKVPPAYAMLMLAYQATHPEKDALKHILRWRFTDKKLIVETVWDGDGKQERHQVAEFDCVLGTQDKRTVLDLTWQPPGFEGMCRNERGQKVLGIGRGRDDELEVVLDASGEKRPTKFKPNKSCYRLLFRRVKR